jgi:hypothetical protein
MAIDDVTPSQACVVIIERGFKDRTRTNCYGPFPNRDAAYDAAYEVPDIRKFDIMPLMPAERIKEPADSE